ncbi:MAG: PEP-CTERM sorting domain-containing protein [Verrucomicrobia subdivision 3 bacterium]|nr:PEP-CTERM sorting domain-containing protein [Limisphaerales bacterium]
MTLRLRNPLLLLALLVSLSVCAFGQGTFRNLDFESANVTGYSTGGVPITNALPGWKVYLGTFEIDWVLYNDVSIGAAAISLQGPGSSLTVLQGSYTVFLQPQFGGGGPLIPIPAIAQTGTVPASAISVRFYGLAGFAVSFAGQTIPISQLDTTPNYNIYGGDISMFANQTGELRFTGGGYLDMIHFSAQAVPEPSMFGLLGFSALRLGWQLRRKPKL